MKNNWNKLAPSLLLKSLPFVSPIDQCAILCALVDKNVKTKQAGEAIRSLKESRISFWNQFLVSDFASAALHLLGIEEYAGDREETRQLISTNLNFA